jgi:hypothetical protein
VLKGCVLIVLKICHTVFLEEYPPNFFFFLAVLEVELRALYLLGRCSTS